MLKLALLSQDHIVLQCRKNITVWGTAEPGAAIHISMQGKKTLIEADRFIWMSMNPC